MVSVSYPDYDQPLDPDKTVNLKTLGQGYHYITGQRRERAASRSGLRITQLT